MSLCSALDVRITKESLDCLECIRLHGDLRIICFIHIAKTLWPNLK